MSALRVGSFGPIRLQGVTSDLREHNPEAQAENWFGSPSQIGAAEKLRRDAYAQRAVQGVVGPLVQSFWDVEPASESALDTEIARFVERNLFSGMFSWIQALERAAQYLWDGFSILEWIERVGPVDRDLFPLHPGRGSGVWLADLAPRPAWSITALHPRPDNGAHLLEAWQYTSQDATFTRIPGDRALRFVFEGGSDKLYGFAPCRPMFGPHRAKVLLVALEMVQHERAHVGLPQLVSDAGVQIEDEDLNAAELMMQRIRSNEQAYAIPTPGQKIEYVTTKGTTDVHQSIEAKNREILMALAANHEALGSSTSSGSYALAGVQKSVRELVVEHHGSLIADTLNHGRDGWSPVARIVTSNYGPRAALPRVVLRSTPLRNTQALGELVEKLGNAGALTLGADTEEFLREASGLPQERRPFAAPEKKATP